MGLWRRVWDYGGGYGTMMESMEVKKGGGGGRGFQLSTV